MGESEPLDKNVKAAEAALKEEKAQVEAREAAGARTHRDGPEGRRRAATTERCRLVKGITPATYQRYERVRKARKGLAVAEVLEGRCSACNMSIRPQYFQDLKKGDQILVLRKLPAHSVLQPAGFLRRRDRRARLRHPAAVAFPRSVIMCPMFGRSLLVRATRLLCRVHVASRGRSAPGARNLQGNDRSQSGFTTGATTPIAEAVAERLRAAGFPEADIFVGGAIPKKANVVVRYHGTGRASRILLLAHIDVVEAMREDWTLDPFTLLEKDGYFYGRGTMDDKAQAAVWVANLIRYKREGFQPDRDLIVALTADEEGGGPYNGVDLAAEKQSRFRSRPNTP